MGRKILLIDDNVAVHKLFKYYAKDFDIFQLDTVDTTDLAFNHIFQAQKEQKLYNCIICDIRLQKNTGFDFLKEMRAKGINIPIVLITGFPEEYTNSLKIENLEDTRKIPPVEILSKDIGVEQILRFTFENEKN